MAVTLPFPSQSVIVETDDPEVVQGDGDVSIQLSDGSVVVDLAERRKDSNIKFDDNLAEDMDEQYLTTIAESLLQGIESDLSSRAEWETTRTRGIELLGLKIEAPRSDLGSSSAPLEGMATIRDSSLLDAVLRFQANAIGELLPAEGPVKIKNVGMENTINDELAESFEEEMNHYLTDIATEYYPDTKRLLFWTGFGGSGWKKVYSCPIRRRPVAESIDANDIIVSNAATDLWNAGRVTHRITMRPSVMKRMQFLKVYRDVPLTQPTPSQNRVEDKKESIEGVRASQTRPEDQPYTLYECYCEWDMDEYAPTQFKGKSIPLPYRVTIDKDSHQVLEIHRNWKEPDEACLPRKYFVRYPYIEGMGLYGIGLVHVMGNTVAALTGAKREMLDAGMFACFPGFLVAKSATKQLTNEFRIPPGGGVPIDVSQSGGDVNKAVSALPYKDVTPGLMSLVTSLQEEAQHLGQTAEIQVGEGKQDAPVGTTLALLEQATKVSSSIHKGLHHAQAEEFQLLKERFREDPEAFWRHCPEGHGWNEQKVLAALENCDMIPVADPNTPSHMHRIAKALAIKQLQAANPQLYDARAVDKRILAMIKVDDADDLFASPNQGQAPDPKIIEATAKLKSAQNQEAKIAGDAKNEEAKLANDAAEREAKKDVETLKLAQTMITHAHDVHHADRTHVLAVKDQAHQHALDLTQTAIDAHSALNPPKPSGGKK